MEQFRQIGEVLGSLKALMVFRDEILINKRQCCLLVDVYNLGFEVISEEMRNNLKFSEKTTKWKALEHPLKELHRIFREGEQYIRQCLETKDWWVKAISLAQNTDCVEFYVHNLLCIIPIVLEAIDIAGEIAGCDVDEMQRKKVVLTKKYEKVWMDPELFQCRFGKQYLVSQDICHRIDTVWREDRWILLELISEKRSLGSSGALKKQENRVAELLFKNLDGMEPTKGKLFPTSFLVGSKDYQVRRRLGNGSQYKEIQWMGESFAIRHFFGDIEALVPEISHLSSLAHPNIMNFLCAFSDEEMKECFLVMQLMNKDLSSYIKELCSPRKKVPFSLPVAVDIMLQIARGMEYLHSRSIYHGNLNPSNVLIRTRSSSVEGYLHAKVAGFGLSSVKNVPSRTSPNQTPINTFIWHAPEILSEQEQPGCPCKSKYTEKADVYSFAMICFELLTGKTPFEEGHLQGDQMSRNIRAGERPLFPFGAPKYLTNLTKKCWHADPLQRPNFSTICRILRYIKRFLIMNPDHSQPEGPMPLFDYFDLETILSNKFSTWSSNQTLPVFKIPFQIFAYRVIEKEKTAVNMKERCSESGSSEGTSLCSDENAVISEDLFTTPLIASSSPSQKISRNNKKTLAMTPSHGKAKRNSDQLPKGRNLRPPQLMPCGRSLRMNSESQLQPVAHSPSRRRKSGNASDSELTCS
ncbi:hypothetical protein AAC387_Pa01g2624 [Persea americana]